MKRSSKGPLVMQKHVIDKILSGGKDWEILSTDTSRRGWIHFAQSSDGNYMYGRPQLVDSFELAKSEFLRQTLHHCVPHLSQVPYTQIYTWVLRDAERFSKPFKCKQRGLGPIIWVRLCGAPEQ